MQPLAPSGHCHWAAAARQEFGMYLLTILPENGRMPSAETTVSSHTENCNSAEESTTRPIHNPTSSCPPPPWYRNRDSSLVTLVPSRTTCLAGPFREMTLICNEFMRDGSLSAPPETQRWPLLAGYRLEVDWGPGWGLVATRAICWPWDMSCGQIRRCPCTAAIPWRTSVD